MATKKPTSIKVKTPVKFRAKTGRVKPKRKIKLKRTTRPDTGALAAPMEKPASRPRKRNALVARRVPKVNPYNVPEPESEVVPRARPVAISRALYENIPEDFQAPWIPAPDDETSAEDTSRNRGRMLGVILVASAILGVFNSDALVNRVRNLPAGPVEERIINAAETWHQWMEAEKLTTYISTMRKQIESLKEANW